MNVTVLGIDISKTIFQLHGVNEFGKTILKKKISRNQLLIFVANLPACLIGIENLPSTVFGQTHVSSVC